MKETGRGKPHESWNPDTGVYKLTHTRHLLANGKGINKVDIDATDSTVRINPTDEENPARVITRVTARGESEQQARDAALAKYREMSSSRTPRTLRLDSQRPEREEIIADQAPRPEVNSSFKLFLPDKERTYSVKAEDGNVLFTDTKGDSHIETSTGDIFATDHKEGSLSATTDLGKVVVDKYGGNHLDIHAKDGDVYVNDVDGAVLDITNERGTIQVTGTEVVPQSYIKTETGPISVGVTNNQLGVEIETNGRIEHPHEGFNLEGVHTYGPPNPGMAYYGSFGRVEPYAEKLSLYSREGQIKLHKDTGTESTLPLPPRPRDED